MENKNTQTEVQKQENSDIEPVRINQDKKRERLDTVC